MTLRRISVHLPDQISYDVRLGENLLASAGETLRSDSQWAHATMLFIITDDVVAPLYLDIVRQSLESAGYRVADAIIPAGEESKSLSNAQELWEAMAELGLDRSSLVLALGGGVVGDLAGFVASTYMRGIPVVQIPTTLLAMVDSSVGGKTAIDLPQGKNLVGAFHQPSLVIADLSTLVTLPAREWSCGMAELIKSALLDSDEFFFNLYELKEFLGSYEMLHQKDDDALGRLIAQAIVFKAGIVAQDVTERAGVRQCLNYGHTLGHAIETLTGYGSLSHGACVAEGMRFVGKLSVRYEGCSIELVETQNSLLDAVGLPKLKLSMNADALLSVMKHDKKARRGSLQWVLLGDVGQWSLKTLDDEVVLDALKGWLA